MTRILALALGISLLGGTALAQNQAPQRPAQQPPRTDTFQILNQRIPELTFQDLPLEQVMQWLGEFTQLNISVRWQILQDAGVDKDKPISIQARNLRLSQVLWLIMNDAGGSEIKLGYRASGNLLVLSTAEDLDKEMVTKIYDVSDLLITLPTAQRQGAFNVTQGMGQLGSSGAGGGGGGGGGAGGGMFGQGQTGQQGGYGQGQTAQGGQQEMQQLVDIIRQTIEPDTWRENGGQGSILPYQRSIIVRNTILVHQRLGGYVAEGETVGQ